MVWGWHVSVLCDVSVERRVKADNLSAQEGPVPRDRPVMSS